MLNFVKFSKKILALPFGNAETVDTFTLEKKRQKFAHAVHIHKASSKLTQQTINPKTLSSIFMTTHKKLVVFQFVK